MEAFDVVYYDGRTAAPQAARAAIAGGRLVVTRADGQPLGAWEVAALRLAAKVRDGLPGRIALARDGDARLSFTDPRLAAELIRADRRVAGDRIGELRRGLRRIAVPLALAVAGTAILFAVVLPMLAPVIARQIPVETERRLGAATADAVLALFARPPRRVCTTPAGSAALDALVARLVAAAPMPISPRVRVADAPLVNAFAMPGGEMLVFRGLIDFAQSPEELAGVLAHELAHVALRHPLEMAIRRTTTSVVMGLIFGDVVGLSLFGGVASQLVASSYSREFEEAADDAGLARLRQAAIDGSGQARLMERLAAREPRDEGGMLPSLLATHPPPAARAAQARASDWPSTPALSAAQWQALRAICAPPAPPNTRG